MIILEGANRPHEQSKFMFKNTHKPKVVQNTLHIV